MESEEPKYDVVVVGAGLAGLAAAIKLQQHRYRVLLLEATDRVGGRVKTDLVQGFLLDHGFQVLLTAYPELRKFLPGAYIFNKSKNFFLADPLRYPPAMFSTLFGNYASLKDKVQVLKLRNRLIKMDEAAIFSQNEESTAAALKTYGFSEKFVQNFFNPFFGGIFLENELVTSRRQFDYVFQCFAKGEAAVPSQGMEMIPRYLNSFLEPGTVRTNCKVRRVDNGSVETAEGEVIVAEKVLIATDPGNILQKNGFKVSELWQGVSCFYFSALKNPLKLPAIALNASQNRLVNNFCVISNISPAYALDGKHLISVSVNKVIDEPDHETADRIKLELQRFVGNQADHWRFLKAFRIPHALPDQRKVIHSRSPEDYKINDRTYYCGDYSLNGSLNAALRSGKIVAEALHQTFS